MLWHKERSPSFSGRRDNCLDTWVAMPALIHHFSIESIHHATSNSISSGHYQFQPFDPHPARYSHVMFTLLQRRKFCSPSLHPAMSLQEQRDRPQVHYPTKDILNGFDKKKGELKVWNINRSFSQVHKKIKQYCRPTIQNGITCYYKNEQNMQQFLLYTLMITT